MRRFVLAALLVLGASGAALVACDDGDIEPTGAVEPSTDAEIAGVLVAVHESELALAGLSPDRTQSQAIRAFDEIVVEQHGEALAREQVAFSTLGLTPLASQTSRGLRAAADEAVASLQPLNGLAFDRAYADRQVAFLELALSTVDRALLDAASAGALVTEIRAVQQDLETQLALARDLTTTLAVDAGPPADGGVL